MITITVQIETVPPGKERQNGGIAYSQYVNLDHKSDGIDGETEELLAMVMAEKMKAYYSHVVEAMKKDGAVGEVNMVTDSSVVRNLMGL